MLGHLWVATSVLLGTAFILLLSVLHRGKLHLLRQAFRCLVRSRQLALVSSVCITLSVAGASITLTVHDSLDGYSEMRSESVMGSIDLVLGMDGPSRETMHLSESRALLDDLRGMENVSSANPIVLAYGSVLGGDGAGVVPNTGFMGVFDDTVISLGGFTALDGRAILQEPGADEAYVNPAFLAHVGVAEGDFIFLIYGNMTYPLRVSEMVAASSLGGYGGDRPFIFINMNTAGVLLRGLGTCNAVAIGLEPAHDREETLTMIDQILESHPELSMKIAQDKEAEAYRSSSVLNAPVAVLLIFGMLSLFLGMAVLNNLYRLIIADRLQDLAILRSLGMSRRDIMLTLMDEGMVLGSSGAAIGTMVGISLSAVCLYLLRGVTMWGWGVPVLVIVEPSSVLCCILFGTGSVLLVAFLSSRSVLNRHKHARRKRPLWPIPPAMFILVTVLCSMNLSPRSIFTLALIALLLIAGHIARGRAALAGPSIALALLAWMILTEEGGSFGLLGSALLVTSVMLAGSLVPILLRRWSGQGARGGACARLAVAYLSHPMARLKAPLMTFSSIFILLTVTTGLSGMVISGTERTMDQGAWGLDSMALRNGMEPFKGDLWGQINRTQGTLARENVSTMVPVFLKQTTISLSPQVTTTIGETIDYSVYGLDRQALSLIDMPLTEFNHELFSDPSEVWDQVLSGADLAIIDSNLRYDLTITGQGEGSGIRPGDTIYIRNAEGRSANVTVAGVTEQRLIGGVFVGPRLLTDFLGLSGPNIYLIDYAPGLVSMEQDRCLERDMHSDGVIAINLAGKAEGITEGVADATLAMRLLTFTSAALGVIGVIALSLRTIRDRRMDLASLRSIGMRRCQIVASMLAESVVVASIGLAIGFLSGVTALVGLWELFLRPLNIALDVDWPSIIIIDMAAMAILVGALFLLLRSASECGMVQPER